MTIAGVDLAVFQGPPADWKPQAGAISWAGVKATELSTAGPYVNPTAEADLAFLRDNGKGRVLYHFGHPDTSPGESARFFLGEISRLGFGDEDAVALDLEQSGGKSPAAVAAWAYDVLSTLEKALDRRPVLYSFLSFIEQGNCAGLGFFPLWIADWSSPAGRPTVPRPWNDWAIHQWRGTGPIDRDVANFGDLAAMRAALGRKVPKVTFTSWKADGQISLATLAERRKTGASTILRMTGSRGLYDAPLAGYIDGVFSGAIPPTAPLPAGTILWVPS